MKRYLLLLLLGTTSVCLTSLAFAGDGAHGEGGSALWTIEDGFAPPRVEFNKYDSDDKSEVCNFKPLDVVTLKAIPKDATKPPICRGKECKSPSLVFSYDVWYNYFLTLYDDYLTLSLARVDNFGNITPVEKCWISKTKFNRALERSLIMTSERMSIFTGEINFVNDTYDELDFYLKYEAFFKLLKGLGQDLGNYDYVDTEKILKNVKDTHPVLYELLIKYKFNKELLHSKNYDWEKAYTSYYTELYDSMGYQLLVSYLDQIRNYTKGSPGFNKTKKEILESTVYQDFRAIFKGKSDGIKIGRVRSTIYDLIWILEKQ